MALNPYVSKTSTLCSLESASQTDLDSSVGINFCRDYSEVYPHRALAGTDFTNFFNKCGREGMSDGLYYSPASAILPMWGLGYIGPTELYPDGKGAPLSHPDTGCQQDSNTGCRQGDGLASLCAAAELQPVLQTTLVLFSAVP